MEVVGIVGHMHLVVEEVHRTDLEVAVHMAAAGEYNLEEAEGLHKLGVEEDRVNVHEAVLEEDILEVGTAGRSPEAGIDFA